MYLEGIINRADGEMDMSVKERVWSRTAPKFPAFRTGWVVVIVFK